MGGLNSTDIVTLNGGSFQSKVWFLLETNYQFLEYSNLTGIAGVIGMGPGTLTYGGLTKSVGFQMDPGPNVWGWNQNYNTDLPLVQTFSIGEPLVFASESAVFNFTATNPDATSNSMTGIVTYGNLTAKNLTFFVSIDV